MSLEDDLIEVANIEVMRRVLEPVDDDMPDPGGDFEACVKAILERTKRAVKPLSEVKRHAYFLEKARSSMEWCRRTKAPAEITGRVEQWLDRLERRWPS
jgi:hypothetical protein